jgi:hypothetical protein
MNFKQLTYKKKNRILLICAVLMLICIYKLAVSETISCYSECGQLEEQVRQLENIPGQIQELQKKIRTTEIQAIEGPGKQKELLEVVSSYCEKNELVLREFPRTEKETKENLEVETSRFTVQGEFLSLLRLVYELEQKDRIGRIASVNYHLEKDQKTKVISLCADVYVQRIKTLDHEI